MKSSARRRSIFLFVGDLLVLNVLYHLTFYLRFQTTIFTAHSSLLSEVSPTFYFLLEGVMSAVWVLGGTAFKLYGDRRGESFSQEALRLTRTILAVAGAVFVGLVFTRVGIAVYSRWFIFMFFAGASVMMFVWRGALHLVRLISTDSRNVLVIGAGKTGVRFFERISNQPSGYRVIGFLDNNGVGSAVRPMILGKLSDLDDVALAHDIDEVVIALPSIADNAMRDLVNQCENLCLRVNIIPNQQFYESAMLLDGKMAAVQVGDIPLVRVREEPLDNPFNKFVKRTFDIVFSLFVMVVLFPPVFLFAAIGIKLSSRGPIFFMQERTGENNKSFKCYKFRTMRNIDRAVADSLQAQRHDPRVTGIGRLLRRTNLDELPQFWNVLKGEMSVVGPRPHMLKHTNDYRQMILQYMVRHFVKPGVTGWAQVNGLRGATETPALMQKRVEYDIYYIEHWSFWFDLKIVLLTTWTMIVGDDHAY